MSDNPDFNHNSYLNAYGEVDKSSSEAMGRDQARKGQERSPQQSWETFDQFNNRSQGYNDANK
jgi:hypothetical protein